MTLLWIKYLTVVECWANCNMNECLVVCLFLCLCTCEWTGAALSLWPVETDTWCVGGCRFCSLDNSRDRVDVMIIIIMMMCVLCFDVEQLFYGVLWFSPRLITLPQQLEERKKAWIWKTKLVGGPWVKVLRWGQCLYPCFEVTWSMCLLFCVSILQVIQILALHWPVCCCCW